MMEDTPHNLIRHLAEDERPREKALERGIKSLSDAELMAIIFATGIRGKSVLELSREIIGDHGGDLSLVAELSARDLMNRYKGIGQAKAVSLMAALELGTRARVQLERRMLSVKNVTSPEQALSLVQQHFYGLDHEEFWMLMLSNSAKPLGSKCIGVGGQTATVVDVKVVIRTALEHKATRLILFHNHPSGTLRPSAQDDALTKKIANAAQLLDIRVDDHIIVTDTSFYSYQAQGRL